MPVVKPFLKNHPGGNNYDLTKWSKKEREEYTLGTKAFSRRIGTILIDSKNRESTSCALDVIVRNLFPIEAFVLSRVIIQRSPGIEGCEFFAFAFP
jgi:hypothetical protein